MSDRPKDWKLDCKVYVGELGYGAAKQELEDVFSRYGRLRNVWVARNPPGFAFVEFEDRRDAEDACKALDGTRINGRRVKIEMSSGKSRWGSRGPPVRRGHGGGYGGGGGGGSGYGGGRRRSRSRSPPVRRPRSRSRSRSNSPGKYGSWSGDKRRRDSSDKE